MANLPFARAGAPRRISWTCGSLRLPRRPTRHSPTRHIPRDTPRKWLDEW